jgi:poly(3-hydroxybutyrate) depolymerase
MRTSVIVLTVFVCAAATTASAAVVEKSGTFNGIALRYKVVLPEPYDPARAYPVVLAFPWGGQDMRSVDSRLEANWRAEAEKRGYIIVSPEAPGGQLFFDRGAAVFPAFLDRILTDYKVQGGKLHIAGASNGGLSAFHVAALYPKYFASVLGYPGYLPEPTAAAIEALKPLCIFMYVGERDPGWLGEMERQAAQFRRSGLRVQYTVEKDQEHGIRALTGAGSSRLFQNIEAAARGCN